MPQDNPFLLSRARRAWESLSEFRRTRERNKRYCYGDQWSDVITVDGKTMTEREYIERQGSVPLKSNLIRRLVRNVIGIWRSQDKQPVCTARDRDEQEYGETMSTVLQYNWQLNRMDELNARCLEEFLISSMAVQKKTFGRRNRQTDCWTDLVQPDRFFIDEGMRDVRGWDVQLLGEVHDMSFEALCAAFAHSAADCRQLAELYPCHAHTREQGSRAFGQDNGLDDDFLHSADSGLCRVIEVWTKENRPFY